eukprot:TRINITY_DN34179_c0_g1_i1.p2 TRINITY_DN34179_c0_g1~~TRINITY_DN34179_c0_g1_i1.p2  ORF type:complete len:160 (+),score=9.54 TRINITY_DN34179_c0_g1_i1:71-550(+)
MDETTAIILIICGVLLLLLACAVVATDGFGCFAKKDKNEKKKLNPVDKKEQKVREWEEHVVRNRPCEEVSKTNTNIPLSPEAENPLASMQLNPVKEPEEKTKEPPITPISPLVPSPSHRPLPSPSVDAPRDPKEKAVWQRLVIHEMLLTGDYSEVKVLS